MVTEIQASNLFEESTQFLKETKNEKVQIRLIITPTPKHQVTKAYGAKENRGKLHAF
jgi:hypothetical protein